MFRAVEPRTNRFARANRNAFFEIGTRQVAGSNRRGASGLNAVQLTRREAVTNRGNSCDLQLDDQLSSLTNW